MCGIAGIVAHHQQRHEIQQTLSRMVDSLVHRGPDDVGYYCEDGIGIGMRRLSVIDVDGGGQPIANEDGQVQAVCNGEIYNFREMRSLLTSQGHKFRTKSDVEVIAHLYEEKGTACFDYLHGMFAIAIWDNRLQRLIIARDRLGKKPLFYAHKHDGFVFGSEIKALLSADPSLSDEDPLALANYLRFGFMPDHETMFRKVHKLPPGKFAIIEDGRVQFHTYWSLTFTDSKSDSKSKLEWTEELDRLLQESVRTRLVSDVPLGIFLSGGLDSSAMVAHAHAAGLQPCKTFTIAFDRREWDESPDAEIVANHFRTDHQVLELREDDMRRDLPGTVMKLVSYFDEPFGDTSALPTYFVSKLAREHVKVILSGDGGDELFAGYTTYQGIKFAEMYRRLPNWLGRQCLPAIADGFARCLPGGKRYAMLRAARVLRDSSLSFADSYFTKSTICGDPFLKKLLNSDTHHELGKCAESYYPVDVANVLKSSLSTVNKMSYADIRVYLLEDMLVKVDRMSMAMVGDYLSCDNGHLPRDIFNHNFIQQLLDEHRACVADHSTKI